MTHFTIKGGAQPRIKGAPPQMIAQTCATTSAAFVGQDMPDLRPKFVVSQGDHVACGQTVFTDRKHPEIAFVSPVSGTVSQLAYGSRRTLSACIIDAVGQPDVAIPGPVNPDTPVRETLLARGMWPAFRARPFGRMPTPTAVPAAIFVNATATSALAPEPAVVLDDQRDAFQAGVAVLTQLTDGPVFVCQARGRALCVASDQVLIATFSGSWAAGLTGTHIDRLHPAGVDQQVWSIGYQDVAAIGHLFQTGCYAPERVVSLVGPAVATPRLVRTTLGANIADISQGEIARAVSGDPYTGRAAQYLGRFHDQITLLPVDATPNAPNRLSRFLATKGALVPTNGLDRALGLNILAVPLMRALSVADTEAAARLGCLDLIEEDVAALTRRCTSGADYGVMLRHVLDDLMKEAG